MVLNKGKEKKLVITGASLLIGTIFTGLILSCVSWFSITNKFNPEDLSSSILTSYFDHRYEDRDADGSLDNPFVISEPIHYYNLIGLHQTDKDFTIGDRKIKFYQAAFCFEFGKDFDGDGDLEFRKYDSQGHKIEGDFDQYLNMGFYSGDNALAPLGTASHPFLGQIEGHNLTISNLHIDGTGCSDIGVFGYICSSAKVRNLYFDNVDIDARDPDPTEANTIYHTQPHSGFANVGYIAGHVEKNNCLEHVYINNCKIRNSTPENDKVNSDYGYIGYAQGNSNPVPTGDGFEYQFNPNNVYDYLNNNYGSIKGNNLVLRHDYSGTGSGALTTAIGHSTSGQDHYTIEGRNADNPSAGHSYGLSTIGYTEGDSVNNTWWKEGGSYVSLPENCSVMEDEPAVVGDYVYFDGLKWNYYQNTPAGDNTLKEFGGSKIWCLDNKPNLAVNSVWEWVNSGTRHYLTRSRNSSTCTLSSNGQDLCILDKPGRTTTLDCAFIMPTGLWGQPCYRTDICQSIYIVDHYPSGDESGDNGYAQYLYVNKDTKRLAWGKYDVAAGSGSMACKFEVSTIGGGCLYFRYQNQKYVVYRRDTALFAGLVGQVSPVYFVVGGGSADSGNGLRNDRWDLVTNLNQLRAGDQVTLVYTRSKSDLRQGDVDVMTKKQSTNNRKSACSDSLNSQMCHNPEFASLTWKVNSDGTYSFLDNDNGGGYLKAHSSLYNSLRVGAIYDDNTHFSISIDPSTSQADIVARGDSTHNRLRYILEDATWNCVENPADGAKPFIFKRVENGYTTIFKMAAYRQNTYARLGGVNSTITDVYYSVGDQQNYTILTEEPENLGEWNFNADGYASTSTVEMSSSGGGGLEDAWVRCMEKSDLEVGGLYCIATYTYDNCGTAGPIEDNGMKQLNGSTFGGNGKIITSLDVNTVLFTLGGNDSTGWTFTSTTGRLCSEGKGQVNLSSQGEDRWEIAFAGNFFVTLTNYNENYGHLAFQIIQNAEGEDEKGKFTTLDIGKNILLYKKTTDVADVTYISDEIAANDPYYNSDYIEAVGGCSFYEDHVTLDAGYVNNSVKSYDKAHTTLGSTGADWYNMYSCSDAIIIKVPNLGSLDFGTIVLEGQGGTPQFSKGTDLDTPRVKINDRDIGCTNELSAGDNFRYTLSLNVYNIFNLSYCALDEEGKILSSYDYTGDQITPADNDDVITHKVDREINRDEIKAFILVLTASELSNSTKISKVTYKFNAAQGNMIDFGLVGYRSATYVGGQGDNQGNTIDKEISQVKGPIMSFEYLVPDNASYFYVSVAYAYSQADGKKYVYTITFRCSDPVTFYIFNYDAQRELIKLNGTQLFGAYNEISITASTPPQGGWTK